MLLFNTCRRLDLHFLIFDNSAERNSLLINKLVILAVLFTVPVEKNGVAERKMFLPSVSPSLQAFNSLDYNLRIVDLAEMFDRASES
jgi:hypothetical protein